MIISVFGPDGQGATAFSSGLGVVTQKGAVTVEDASLMHAEFACGAIGSFESSRFATGRKNHNTFEIYGSEGSLTFDLERTNELQFFPKRSRPCAGISHHSRDGVVPRLRSELVAAGAHHRLRARLRARGRRLSSGSRVR